MATDRQRGVVRLVSLSSRMKLKSRKNSCSKVIVALFVTGLSLAETRADENLFGYTYTADVLPRGKWELEQWATARTGKESGTFLGTDLRTEIERGFTDRLQGSLYLNYNYFYVHDAVASRGPIDDRNFFG